MSQNPFSKKVKIYTFSAIALIAAAILLRTVNFLCIFDTATYYFSNHPLHTVYRTLCLLTVLWLLSMILFIPRYSFSTHTAPIPGIFSRSMGLFCACTAAASFFYFRDCMFHYIAHAKLYQLLSIFSLLSAIWFLLHFLNKVSSAFRALTGYATLIWLGLMLSVTYLNLFVTMNSPFKVTLHLAILAMMLHVLEDARHHAGRPFRITRYAYTLIAILNCSVASLPVLLAYLLGLYPNVDYLFYAVLMLGFSVYLIARALDDYRVLMVTSPATPEEIEEDKKKREEKNKKKQKKTVQATEPTENEKGDDSHVS